MPIMPTVLTAAKAVMTYGPTAIDMAERLNVKHGTIFVAGKAKTAVTGGVRGIKRRRNRNKGEVSSANAEESVETE